MAAKRCMLLFPSFAFCLPICLTVCLSILLCLQVDASTACGQRKGVLDQRTCPVALVMVCMPVRQKHGIMTIKPATLCRAD
jgi:hypothetical protein